MRKCSIAFSLSSNKMFAARKFVILFLLSLVTQFSHCCSHRYEGASGTTKKPDFEILVFTQTWPATTCFQWKAKHPSNKCLLPKQETWKIHGLWPTQYHKPGPSFCDENLRFDESILSPIVHELDEKWPNTHYGKSHSSFWRFEWRKHGTCATVLDDLNTELKYFRKALSLMNEFDMTRVLAKAKILPGQKYAVEEISDGIKNVLGKTVRITCVKLPKTHESYLHEIRICLDKSFRLIDCNKLTDFNWTNCNRKMPVNYLGTTRSEPRDNRTNSISHIETNTLLLLCTHVFLYCRFKANESI